MFKLRRNINTDEFWDVQFKKEWDLLVNNLPGFIRWNPYRFDTLSRFIKNGQRILDVGCGLGHQVRYLKARFPHSTVVGTDFSAFAVEKTKECGNVAVQSSCYNFSKIFQDYDVVIATEIIEHLSKPKKLLKEIHNTLKEGGLCIITTPVKGVQKLEDDHMQEYSNEELRKLMEEYFDDVAIANAADFQLAVGTKK